MRKFNGVCGLGDHQIFVQKCVLEAGGTLRMNRTCANSAAARVEAVRPHACRYASPPAREHHRSAHFGAATLGTANRRSCNSA